MLGEEMRLGTSHFRICTGPHISGHPHHLGRVHGALTGWGLGRSGPGRGGLEVVAKS